MAKTLRNGDVVIRIADIIAVHIPTGESKIVEIWTHFAQCPMRFECVSEKIAKQYVGEIQQMMEKE